MRSLTLVGWCNGWSPYHVGFWVWTGDMFCARSDGMWRGWTSVPLHLLHHVIIQKYVTDFSHKSNCIALAPFDRLNNTFWGWMTFIWSESSLRSWRNMKTMTTNNLKLPSLFVAWLFWTFHNKSHNMKALVILKSFMITISPAYLFIWKKMNLRGSLCSLLEYFLKKKTPPRLPMQITWPWPPVGRFGHGLITVRQ